MALQGNGREPRCGERDQLLALGERACLGEVDRQCAARSVLGQVVVDRHGHRCLGPGQLRDVVVVKRTRRDVDDRGAVPGDERFAHASEPLRWGAADRMDEARREARTGAYAQRAVFDDEEPRRTLVDVLLDEQVHAGEHELERRSACDELEDLGLRALEALVLLSMRDVAAHEHDRVHRGVVEQVGRSQLQPRPAPVALARAELAYDRNPRHAQQDLERLFGVGCLVGVGVVEDVPAFPVRRRLTEQFFEVPEVGQHEPVLVADGDDGADVLEELLVAGAGRDLGVGDVSQMFGQIVDERDEEVGGRHDAEPAAL
ncbi:unannotated protein [freshwater metagenome]|uniref:Unannotated protein n=1 Tax=freshwater metagenome TaxID=449393 RepID=A0A6J7APV1_9ZZZZ